MRVHQQAAYVLINRPYSESSWIVEVFSKDYGRIALIAKGARRLKSRLKGVLLPFQPLLVSWTGKGEVPTLTAAEIQSADFNLMQHELNGEGLACGFYCNELISYLLHRYDPHPNLFDNYHDTILDLHKAQGELMFAQILRKFERNILKETGYGVNFELEADGKTPLIGNVLYDFVPGHGFNKQAGNVTQLDSFNGIRGDVILSMNPNLAPGEMPNNEQKEFDMSQGKLLMRDILSHSLGHKKINSRALFFPKSR